MVKAITGTLIATSYAGMDLVGLTRNTDRLGRGRAEQNGRYMAAFNVNGAWLEVALRHRQFEELQRLMDDDDEGLIFDVTIRGREVEITKVDDAAVSGDVSAYAVRGEHRAEADSGCAGQDRGERGATTGHDLCGSAGHRQDIHGTDHCKGYQL